MPHVAKLVIRPCGSEGRFEKEWKWHADRRRLENAVLGVAYQVVDVVSEDTGKVHHEGLIYVSRRIELHIIIRDHWRTTLVEAMIMHCSSYVVRQTSW